MQISAPQKNPKSISNIIHNSKRVSSLIETDDAKESGEKFTEFQNNFENKRCSRYTNEGAVLMKKSVKQ